CWNGKRRGCFWWFCLVEGRRYWGLLLSDVYFIDFL
ncbi:MAG: hypothetical protein ACI9VN_004002, partial [Patescibacteria group bacterium]